MQDSLSERIGRYQLLEPIGGGPNGSVFRAKVFGVAGLERQFAIKRFVPELTASPSAAQALSAAARSYGSLEHPRIARMSEFGVAQGQTFTAVEHVAGLDAMRLMAESRLAGNGLPQGGALALVSQAARAVGYAHGRGLSHLGLSPTNILVTADGDVKVTDFGILAATITARPVDTPRLATRIGYLAPEQLVGESTSAATDVFVLGVIAYELVTGQRAFYGETAQALSQAILSGPPAEPPLPRPIVRVLARCLARSQFERFPDARAFADALDAALRVAPVPGTRKDIGAQVKGILDRHAAMNEGSLSGMVALNVGAFRPPEAISAQTLPPAARSPRPSFEADGEGMPTTEFVRPDVPVGRPAQLVGPASGSRQSPTVPPAIPIPGTIPPPPPPIPSPAHTMLGMSALKKPHFPPVAAPIKPKGASPTISPPVPAIRRPPPDLIESIDEDLVTLDESVLPRAGIDVENTIQEETLVTREDGARYKTSPSGQTKVAPDPDPPTAPHDVLPEVHSRGGLQPFAVAKPMPRGPDTSPSIEVIRAPDDPVLPAPGTATRPPPFKREMPTTEMPDDLVRDLKRASTGARDASSDPLIDLSLQAHGVDATASRTSRSPAKTLHMSGAAVPPASTPLQPRMPSPTPPSLVGRLEIRNAAVTNAELTDPGSEQSTASPGQPPAYAGASPEQPQLPKASYDPGQAAHDPGQPAQASYDPGEPTHDPGQPPFLLAPAQAQTSLRSESDRPQLSLPQHRSARRWPVIAGLLVVVAAGAGVFVWQMWEAGKGSTQKVATGETKGSARAGSNGASGANGSSANVANGSNAANVANGSNAANVANGSNAANVANGSAASANGSGTNVANGSNAANGANGSAANANGSGTNVANGSNAATGANGSGANGSGANGSGASGSGASSTGSNGASGSNAGSNGAKSSGKEIATPTGSSDALQVASTPAGARVFIDGADQGVTPVKLPGSADRHTMALLLAGHDLYVAEADGHGTFQIPLKAVIPSGGAAGIKVIKCKDKDRYYVFVDGKPTGMTCPTERIETDVGPHTVEVYDLVTENRRKWDIKVTDTRLSYRVRVD